MSKKSSVVAKVAASTTEAESVIPAVMAESILPALSVDALIAALMNPESRASTTVQLDTRIAARKAELDQLMSARKALDFVSPIKTDIKKNKFEIPKSANDLNKYNYIPFIFNHLKDEPDGLTILEFCKKANIAVQIPLNKCSIHKKLSRYFISMILNKELIRENNKGRYIYKISPTKLHLVSEIIKGNYSNHYVPYNKGAGIKNIYNTTILNVLNKEKNGLDFKNIRAKIAKMIKADMDTRYLAVELCVMAKNGILSKNGKRGRYIYKISSNAI